MKGQSRKLKGRQPDTLGDALGPHRRRFVWIAVFYAIIILVGMAGYRVIEDWSWGDAAYMTIISITSVGYGEVHPLGPIGRVFTMLLLGLSLIGLGVWWAFVTALVIQLDLWKFFRRRRIMKRIEDLKGHYIVCGAGRMGRVVIEEMTQADVPFVVIEESTERASHFQEEYPDILVIHDDATREHTLRDAHIDTARGLAACLSRDADNLILTLTAHVMAPQITIAARAIDEESVDKLVRAGADHVISPNVTGGVRLATMLLRPSVVSFLDAATVGADISLRLEDTKIPAESTLVGRTLSEARIRERTGLIVLALRRQNGETTFNPGPDVALEAQDDLIVLGHSEEVDALREYAQERATP